jgi:Leucine-rich repeat (LRR) protein
VEELDLASNRLTDLNQIFSITKEMPFLKFLNLSENDLSEAKVDQIESATLCSVRSLVLNNTRVSWQAVTLLLDCLPSLQDLHLSLNNFQSVDLNGKSYPQVRRVYVSKNPALNCWQQIAALLAAFPRLQCLSMADCNVDTIPAHVTDLLPCVLTLNISNWPLDCWTKLERLNQLPKLIELRCQGLRLLQQFGSVELRRQLLIARLPRIRRLNGSEISADERLHAERAFILYYSQNSECPKPKRCLFTPN